MNFQTLIVKYRDKKLIVRLLICLCVGLLPVVGLYLYDIQGKLEELDRQTIESDRLSAKLAAQQKKQSQLRVVLTQEKEMQEQLRIAKLAVPDRYDVETLLLKLSGTAREAGVSVKFFEPKPEQMIEGSYPYFEQRIEVHSSGTYEQIGVFFDKVLSLKPLVAIRDSMIERDLVDMGLKIKSVQQLGVPLQEISPNKRSYLRLMAKSSFYVFRSLTDEELRAYEEKKKAAQKKPAPPPKGEAK